MEERREYDVFKIVRHSERCYLSTDRIRGMPLVRWLKHHTLISKEQAFLWIKELIDELACFHQTRDDRCYQYLNPYSIIVGENDRWYLLDLNSEDQEEMYRLMQRRSVREQFLPADNLYYQKASVRCDLYAIGRTIQYLLSVAAIEPKLGRTEERRLQIIISRCLGQDSKNVFRDMKELSEQFSKIYPPKEKKNNKKWIILMSGVIIALFAAFFGRKIYRSQSGNDAEQQSFVSEEALENEVDYVKELIEKNDRTSKEKEQMKEEADEREKELLYELILMNFKMENYGQCRKYLEEMKEKDSFSKEFDRLCGYVGGESEVYPERELEILLERLEEENPNRGDKRFDYCFLKGFLLLNDDRAKEEVKRLAQSCVSSDEWKEWAGEELVQEVTAMSTDKETEDDKETADNQENTQEDSEGAE
ncbi:MAG: hypothetical protein Q4B75_10515 [Eubacteriales bacterium]|nr:hypothetical protein [Eubacteriales bacterium]